MLYDYLVINACKSLAKMPKRAGRLFSLVISLVIAGFGLLLTPPVSAVEIAIIDIDDSSIERLGRWPWPREIHGKLIEKLSLHNPSAIVFDILFSEPDKRDPGSDRKFLRSITPKPPVYLASVFHLHGSPFSRSIKNTESLQRFSLGSLPEGGVDIREAEGGLFPFGKLGLAAGGIGFTNVFADDRGQVTGFPMIMAFKEKLYPSLPLVVAADYLGIPLNKIAAEPGNFLQLGKKKFPLSSAGELRLNFPKPFTRFKHYSYIQVLENKAPPPAFKNAVVIIGYFATGLADHKVTPVSPYHPGSELIATAIQTLTER